MILLIWGQNVLSNQKIGISFSKILTKVTHNIFILPKEKQKFDFIPSNLGAIYITIKDDLIFDELPIGINLITN